MKVAVDICLDHKLNLHHHTLATKTTRLIPVIRDKET